MLGKAYNEIISARYKDSSQQILEFWNSFLNAFFFKLYYYSMIYYYGYYGGVQTCTRLSNIESIASGFDKFMDSFLS